MKIVIITKTNSFLLNNIEYQKGALTVNHGNQNGISIGGQYADLADIKCDGEVFATIGELRTWVSENLFKSGGGSGTGAVQSVTGDMVTGTSENPVINYRASDVINTIEDWAYYRVGFFGVSSYTGTGEENNQITLYLPANIGEPSEINLAIIPANVSAVNFLMTSNPIYEKNTGHVTFYVSQIEEGQQFYYNYIINRNP